MKANDMTKILVIFVAIILTSCGTKIDNPQWGPDQCIRREIFQECMKALPTGPKYVTAAGNDWDEVVDACSKVAYLQSQREIKYIKPECGGR